MRHEYVNGKAYAMVGADYNHNLIVTNISGLLFGQLVDSPCRALTSTSKLQIELEDRTRVYYPDVTVVCGDKIRRGLFQDRPTLLIEVLSPGTHRADEGEKMLDAYLKLESLQAYLLFDQTAAEVTIYRRSAAGFERSLASGLQAKVDLPSVNAVLALADVYANVDFNEVDSGSSKNAVLVSTSARSLLRLSVCPARST